MSEGKEKEEEAAAAAARPAWRRGRAAQWAGGTQWSQRRVGSDRVSERDEAQGKQALLFFLINYFI